MRLRDILTELVTAQILGAMASPQKHWFRIYLGCQLIFMAGLVALIAYSKIHPQTYDGLRNAIDRKFATKTTKVETESKTGTRRSSTLRLRIWTEAVDGTLDPTQSKSLADKIDAWLRTYPVIQDFSATRLGAVSICMPIDKSCRPQYCYWCHRYDWADDGSQEKF